MKTRALFFLLVWTVCSMIACNNSRTADDSVEQAQNVNDSTALVEVNDSDFAVEAADAGLAEIELGKLALERASDPRIKEFAKTMVDEHNKANDELMTIAAKKNLTLPPVPSADHAENMRELQEKSGDDFDRQYIDQMVKDHNRVVSMFENASENASDPDIRSFAAKTLSTLKDHQENAKELRDSLDGEHGLPEPDMKIMP